MVPKQPSHLRHQQSWTISDFFPLNPAIVEPLNTLLWNLLATCNEPPNTTPQSPFHDQMAVNHQRPLPPPKHHLIHNPYLSQIATTSPTARPSLRHLRPHYNPHETEPILKPILEPQPRNQHLHLFHHDYPFHTTITKITVFTIRTQKFITPSQIICTDKNPPPNWPRTQKSSRMQKPKIEE